MRSPMIFMVPTLVLTSCAHFTGVRPTMTAEPRDIAEFWAKVVAQTDPDPDDGAIVYIFAYVDLETGKEIKLSATASCTRGKVLVDGEKIRVRETRFADITNFSVTCE